MKFSQLSINSILVLGCLFLSIKVAEAQVMISGIVLDEKGSPLSHVTIMLLKPPDSSLVKGGITDDTGTYLLENIHPGNYLLSVSMVGYQRFVTEEFDVNREIVRLGTVRLEMALEELDEVAVTARKPLFEQKIDRLVVNVQQSITSSGNSVLEVLEKSPGIQVNRQSGSISMSGRSGVRVMINDRFVNLPADAVLQILDGMSAANVEQIELISNPPARYEAEGDAGIINIKMTEHIDLGYTGSAGGNLGHNYAEILGGHLNFSQRSRNLAYFINYSINHDRNKELVINERSLHRETFTTFENNISERWPTVNVQNLRAGLEYHLSSRTTIATLFTGYRRLWDMESLSETHILHNPDNELISQMDIHETNKWRNMLANISLKHEFSGDRKFQANLDYLYYINDNPSLYDHEIVKGNSSLIDIEGIDVAKRTPIQFWVSRLDYQHKLSDQFSLETGMKGTWSLFFNDVTVSNLMNGSWIRNNSYSNEADLSEQYGAVYLSGHWSPSDDLQMNGGLRYEFTDSYLSTPEQKGLIDRQGGNLFPTLFIQKQISDSKTIGMSYSRRITRPTFNDMAPFVFFISPNTFLSGNPALKPALSHNVELKYQLNRILISLQYSYADDAIAPWQSQIDTDTNQQTYSAENLDFLRTYSATASIPVEPVPWWEVQANVTGRFQDYKSVHLVEQKAGNATGVTLNLTNTITLPADLTFEMSGYYVSKSIMGFNHFKPQGALNAGLQKRIFDRQGTLRLSANDMLDTDIWRIDGAQAQENVDTYLKWKWKGRSIHLTFTWNFGSSDLQSVTLESGSTEEQDRVNTN